MDVAQSIEFLVNLAAGHGLAIVLVLGGAVFFVVKIWPWYTETERPSQQAIKADEINARTVMAASVQQQALASRALTDVLERVLLNGASIVSNAPGVVDHAPDDGMSDAAPNV